MPTQLIAKLIELAHSELQSDLAEHEIEEESLSLEKKEKEMIERALS